MLSSILLKVCSGLFKIVAALFCSSLFFDPRSLKTNSSFFSWPGNVSQWGEVKKKTQDRSRSKVKDASKTQSGPTESSGPSTRGGRGRGGFESRGRARGDRGRGGRGGRAGAHTNGSRATADAADTTNTGTPIASDTIPTQKTLEDESSTSADAAVKPVSKDAPKVAEPAKKGWASLFAKPANPPPPVKKSTPTGAVAAPAAAARAPAPEKPSEPVDGPETSIQPPPVPPVVPEVKELVEPPAPQNDTPTELPTTENLDPPKDDLTKTNLEQVPDVSHPPATVTAASTIASVQDPHSLPPVTPQTRATSGYATSAFKATTGSARSSSFQRRVLEQQEAVVMPANHAVDRAAVQFGSMGLNGSEDADIDDEREDAETRAQPPQHSPVAPRAALPPTTQTQAPTEAPSIPRPAPGLPPVPQSASNDTAFHDFGRYGDAPKPYDPFSHQVSQPQQQTQEPFSGQAPIQPTATTGSEYSPFYAGDHQRLPYNYYGAYSQSQPDVTAGQRAAAGFGISGAETQQPQLPTSSQPPSRYGHAEAPNSGHNTPNPTLPTTTQAQQSAQQHIPGGQAAHSGYGYQYPYYSNPHYASYMNQMNQQHQYGRNRPMYDDARRYDDHYMPQHNQYGYGNQYAPYGGKGGMYGQPFSYEHSSSPANAGAFTQSLPGRDSVYGRSGSTQPDTQQSTGTSFGSSMPDVFGRSQSGFGQNQPISQQQQPANTEEGAKGYDTSKTGGPSPSLAQVNRPGSATNSAPGQPPSQVGLPPLQGQQGQQSFNSYPHLNPQYGGGLGGLGGHQAGGSQNHHQGTGGYANYGGAGFSNYYGNSGRGGWGGNYGH